MHRPDSPTFIARTVLLGLVVLGLTAQAQAFTLIQLEHAVIKATPGDPGPPPIPPDGPSETSNQPRNSISENGCLVVFTSRATNVAVPQTDTNGTSDVFLFNRCAFPTTVTLVSHQGGRPTVAANGASDQPVITPDGDFVVFRSDATNIVGGTGFGGKTNIVGGTGFAAGTTNIYLWDVTLDTFTLISDGTAVGVDSGDGSSSYAVVSRTLAGRPVVAFESVARNLVVGDGNGLSDVFRNSAGVITLVSNPNTGIPAPSDGASYRPDINGPGNCIVFESYATNLVSTKPSDDVNTFKDVFRWRTGEPAIILLSHIPGTGNENVTGDGESTEASIDDVCERFAFKSSAKNLVDLQDEGNSGTDVFHVGNSGDVELVSHRDGSSNRTGGGGVNPVSYAPILSRDGKWVAYASFAMDLAPGQSDSPDTADVFLYDISGDKTLLVSHQATDEKRAVGGSASPEISRDGRYVAYESDSKELDPNQNDGNGGLDVFLYNRTWNNSVLVSRRYASIAISGNGKSYRPVLSAGEDDAPLVGGLGYFVAFTSEATDLIADDPDSSGQANVFYFLGPGGAPYFVDIPFLTVRSTTNSNTIEWVTWAIDYGSMRTFFSPGTCPAPVTLADFPPGNELFTGSPRGNTRASFTHGGRAPNTIYCYALFVQHDYESAIDPGDAPWRTIEAKTLPLGSTPVQWSINLAGVSSLAQVGIGTQGHVGVANDGGVYGFTRGPSGGFWASSSWPFRVLQPIQGRPPIFPFGTLGAARTTFVGSQDGRVYSFDADRLALAGGALWYTSPRLDTVVQPGASGMFSMFGGIAGANHILIGAYTGGQGSFHVLNAASGASLGSVGGPAMGRISTAASIDYLQKRVYFASLEANPGVSPSLWCMNLTMGGFGGLCWAPITTPAAISGGPVQRAGKLYVGDDAGTTWAFDAASGASVWSTPGCAIGNPIKSFVLADRLGTMQDLYYSAGNTVCALTDNGATVGSKWSVSSIPNPSAPVLARLGPLQTPYIFVGSSNGRLYQINADDPLDIKFVVLRTGTGLNIGAPSYDFFGEMIYVGSVAGVIYAVQVPLP